MRRSAIVCVAPLLVAVSAHAGPTDLLETDERLARLLVPGGLTAAQVAERARASSPLLRAREHGVSAADAKVDEARASFLPKVNASARYTRLSELTMPPFSLGGGSGGSLVVSNATPTTARPFDPATDRLIVTPVPAFSFPVFVNTWSLNAQLAIPVSDYFFRYRDAIEATSGAAEAARLELEGAAKKTDYDARISYYNYIRAQGQRLVAGQALEAAEGHLADARVAFAAGYASKADVLRAESGVHHLKLIVERASNGVAFAEEAIRTAMHAPEVAVTIGENVLDPLPEQDEATPIDVLVAEALKGRPEARGIAVGQRAAERQIDLARAAYYPRLDVVGNATYANPNQRLVPAKDEFTFTWDASLVASWNPLDAIGARAQVVQAKARHDELEAQRDALADGVRLEVTQSKAALLEARSSIATTRLGLASATESYRVRREAFRAGKATLVEVDDAATELTRARLEFIDANIALRQAALRLAYACGRGPVR